MQMNFRVRSIDGCRGLAAIIVLFTHFFPLFFPAVLWGQEYIHLQHGLDYLIGQTIPIPSAYSGVALFFIITGFGTYIAVDGGNIDIRKYLLLRYFKLLLLTLLGALPVILLLQANLVFVDDIAHSVKSPWFHNWPSPQLSLWYNLLHEPLASLKEFNGVLWTMEYFFIGTLLSFILTRIFSRSLRGNIYISLIAILIMVNLCQYYYISFVAGVLMAYCYKYKPSIFQTSTPAKIIIFLTALYFCSYPTGVVGPEGIYLQHDFEKAYIPYNTLGAILIALMVLMPQSMMKQAMESKVFQWLGHYSMGIYLVHFPLVISLMAFLYQQLPESLAYPHRIMLLMLVYTMCGIGAGIPVQAVGDCLFRLTDRMYKHIFGKYSEEQHHKGNLG